MLLLIYICKAVIRAHDKKRISFRLESSHMKRNYWTQLYMNVNIGRNEKGRGVEGKWMEERCRAREEGQAMKGKAGWRLGKSTSWEITWKEVKKGGEWECRAKQRKLGSEKWEKRNWREGETEWEREMERWWRDGVKGKGKGMQVIKGERIIEMKWMD